MAQWSTLMPCNREAAGSNLWGFGFSLKGALYQVDYSEKNFFSWTAMHIDFVMCKNWDKLYTLEVFITQVHHLIY